MAYDPSLYGPPVDPAKTASVDKGKEVEGKAPPDNLARRYLREIERYNRANMEWHSEGEEIETAYLSQIPSSQGDPRRFPLLWANVETLKPAVYPKVPVVQCSRRYKDRDPIGRVCAEIMERATNTSWDLYGVDETFRLVRDDRLLPGRGQGWVRYEAHIERIEEEVEVTNPETGETMTETSVHERVAGEKVCVDYVHWCDFGHNVARTWQEVWLVWRVVYKTQEEAAERFGAEWASKLTYNAKSPNGSYNAKAESDSEDNRAKIYELWDKRNGLTSWLAESQDEFLDSGPPPVKFRNGFPCPRPCYATKTSKSLTPVPDYTYYRDQAKEINDLTAKIHRLTQWLTVKAFIPGGPSSVADPIADAVTEKSNDELFVEVDSWKEWTDRGGAGKIIDWLPIDKVVQALTAAISARQQLKQDVWELTGVSDLLRGQTNPNETLGAQELKAQTGSRRLKNTRDELAEWCKEIGLLTAEAIAEQFSPQSIAEITGFKYVPQQQQPMQMGGNVIPFPGAQGQHMGGMMPTGEDMGDDPELVFDDRHVALLRNDKMRSFRIDVETDQTGQADENMEKQRAVELLTAVGGFMEKTIATIAQAPEMAPASKELLMHTLRRFRTGKAMEDTLDRGFSNLAKTAMAARQRAMQQPPPEIAKAQAQAQADAMTARTDAQIAMAKVQTDARIATGKQQQDAQLEIRKQNLDAALKMRQMNVNASAQRRDAATQVAQRQQPSTMQ